jgi:uncharacterized membrane-anchored protein YjiN (DUF445 family)
MGEIRRNRLGGLSLISAIAGFLVVELQPWLPLASIGLFGSLSLKGLLEAFFEASMAGAFADWFAVSALFRDPLGFSLPHTNILAKNKDAIADAIPRFLAGFLRADALAAEFARVDYAAKAAEALSGRGNREAFHEFLRTRASGSLLAYGGGVPGARDAGKAEAFRSFVGDALDFAAERIDAPSALAALLAWAKKERFDERILEGIAEYARLEIGRNRSRIVAMITPLVKRNAGWQGLFIGTGTVERFLVGIEDELAEMKADKGNEIRRFVLGSVTSYASRLDGSSPGGSSDREALSLGFREALADPAFRRGFADFAASLLQRAGEDLAGPEGRFIPALERIEDSLISRIASDEELRGKLNAIVVSLLGIVVEKGRVIEGASEYIAGLIRSTEDAYFVERIEEAVWNDMQYIRVNGAVVGGLVGLVVALVKAAVGS